MNAAGSGPGDGGEVPPLPSAPSRKKATLGNLFFTYSKLVLVFARNILVVPIYLRFIEFEEYGAWLATGGVLGSLIIANFGLMAVLPQKVGEAYGSRDRERLQKVIGSGLVIISALSLVVAVVAMVLSPLIPKMFHVSGDTATRLAQCFLIVGLAKGMNLLSQAAGGVMRSLQRPAFPGVSALVTDMAGLALSIFLVFRGWGLYAIAWGLAFQSVLVAAVNVAGCIWTARVKIGLRPGWSLAEARSLWSSSIYQFLTSMALRVQSNIDPVVVGMALGPEIAGAYVLTIRAHETVRLIASAFGVAIAPSLSHLHGDGKKARFREIVVASLKVQVVTAAIGMGGVVACNHSFVRTWIGEQAFAGNAVTVLFAVLGIVYLMATVLYDTLIAMGEFRRVCGIVWIITAIRLPLLVGLVYLGLWGVPTAALVSYLILLVLLARILVRLLAFPGKQARIVRDEVARILVPAVTVAGLILWLWKPEVGWLPLALRAAAFAVPALALILLADRNLLRTLRQEIRLFGRG